MCIPEKFDKTTEKVKSPSHLSLTHPHYVPVVCHNILSGVPLNHGTANVTSKDIYEQ